MRFALLALLVLGLFGCTENVRARQYGGTTKIVLPCDTKLVTATWKEGNLWYLTRVMRAGEEPETQSFIEESSLGLLNGKVLFGESTCK